MSFSFGAGEFPPSEISSQKLRLRKGRVEQPRPLVKPPVYSVGGIPSPNRNLSQSCRVHDADDAVAAPKPAGLFPAFGAGSTPAAPSNPSTSLFGQQPPSTNSTSGAQAQPSTSLFGAPQPQAQQPQTNQGGGLFGSNNAGTSGTAGGGGLFGSTTQQGGGLFGASSQPPQQQQQQGGGLFGSTTGNQQSGGLFGSTQQQQQQPQQQQGGGLFGSTTQQPQQQQQQGGLFGSTAQPPSGGSMFGAGAGAGGSSMFGAGASTNQPQQQQQQLQQSQGQNGNLGQSTLWKSTIGGGVPEQDIETRIMNVKNAWDPSAQEYKFKVCPYDHMIDMWWLHITLYRGNGADLGARRLFIMWWIRVRRISMDANRGSAMSCGRCRSGRIQILQRKLRSQDNALAFTEIAPLILSDEYLC